MVSRVGSKPAGESNPILAAGSSERKKAGRGESGPASGPVSYNTQRAASRPLSVFPSASAGVSPQVGHLS